MSDFDLAAAVEEFCSHATYVEEGGRSKLQDLLFKTNKTIASVVLELLGQSSTDSSSVPSSIGTKHYELIEKFFKKISKYRHECCDFLISSDLGKVCDLLASVDKHNAMKVAFVQLFLQGSSSNVQSLRVVVSSAISWVASDSLELSDCSSQVLAQLVAADESLAADVISLIMPQLVAVENDSTLHLRYLCLLSSFMKISSEYFLLCETKGAAAAVVASCQCPDILVQTISLDFLVDISSTPAGAIHLFTNEKVHWLVAMGGGSGGEVYLDQAQGHAVEDFLIAQATSSAAKVLKNVEQHAPHMLYDYITSTTPFPLAAVLTQPTAHCSPLQSVFVSGLLDLLDHTGEAERLACLEAISTYATSSPRAFLLLLGSDRLVEGWLNLLRKQPSIQASTLHSVAQVLMYPAVLGDYSPDVPFVRAVHSLPAFSSLPPADLPTILTEMDSTKRKIFGQICLQLGTSKYESTMDYLVRLAKGPLEELKHAAYDILRALAYQIQMWGVHTLFEHTSFYPFLLDRSTEHAKTGKDWKFSLLQALHHSPHIELLVEAIPTRIHELIREGAYHTPLEVAGPITMEL